MANRKIALNYGCKPSTATYAVNHALEGFNRAYDFTRREFTNGYEGLPLATQLSNKEFNLLPETKEKSPEDSVEVTLFSEAIPDLLERLDSKERIVLSLRYGLGNIDPLSYRSIAKLLDISKSNVQYAERRGLFKLRTILHH